MRSWGGDGRLEAAFLTGDLNWDDERKRSGGVDKPLLSVVRGPSAISEGGEGGDCDHDDTAKWEDVWLERCAGQEGYTYDSKENPMLRGNLRRRFDRCLVYALSERKVASDNGGDDNGDKQTALAAHSVRMIGTEPIDGLVWKKEVQKWVGGRPTGGTGTPLNLPVLPSDHYGLYAILGDSRVVPPKVAEKKGKKSTSKRKR